LVLELERRGAAFERFNTEDYPTRTRVSWSESGPSELIIGTRCLVVSEVPAVWYRRPVPPTLPATYDAGRAQWAAAQAREALDGVWRTLEARWVNHPDKNRIADGKLAQLQRARSVGLDVPASLVTNDPESARAFCADHPAGVIVKPVVSGRLLIGGAERIFFTSLLDTDAQRHLEQLGPEPYLLQALVHKRYDVRVTVIDSDAFATRIESQSDAAARVDWRRGNTTDLVHAIEDLPAEIADRCVQLVRSYGLLFAAVDFAVDQDGRYVFFEINPNGQWAWIEQRTGLPLRARLADLLLGVNS
jgi:glutathione synthase/RimK-type ligase-like ATP-grasp enzyme